MKKTFLLTAIIAAFIFSSCTKDDPVSNTENITVRYDFTTDKTGNYNFTYSADSSINYDAAATLTWSKTITITNAPKSAAHTASLTVYPPADWVGTANLANVTIKISVNDVIKSSNAGVLGGEDRPTGLTTTTTY